MLGESLERRAIWKLRDSPFGPGCAMVVRDDAGAVVAMNAFQSARITNGAGFELNGHQSMDTVVTKSARGKGLFTRMYRAYYELTDADFVYGFPNKNSAPGFFNKLGWTRFGAVPMRIKPLRTGFLARRLKLGALDFKLPSFRRSTGTSSKFTAFRETHEEAWRSTLRKSEVWGLDRSKDYLNWRYRHHPSFTYELRDRPDGSFLVSTILDKHDAKILYVMEALGEPNILVDLLREVHEEACREGAELALAWGAAQSPMSSIYSAAGYSTFPERFRTNEIHFGARIFTDAPAPRTGEDWFVSYSDSDTV